MPHRHPYRDEIRRVERTGMALAAQVERLQDADWGRPTPCPGWTVRHVVGHTASIVRDLPALATGAPLPPPLTDADLTSGASVAERIRHALVAGAAAWRSVHLAACRDFPWGRTPAVRALQFTGIEIVGHGWDVAVASGIPIRVRDDDAEALLRVAVRDLPGAARPGLFDDARRAPAGSTALDRLAAALGRSVGVPAHG